MLCVAFNTIAFYLDFIILAWKYKNIMEKLTQNFKKYFPKKNI